MLNSIELTNFVNIHFTSKDLGKLMIDQDRTAMLYWVYNEKTVNVLVCHDIKEGVFVLQVPYFPPV